MQGYQRGDKSREAGGLADVPRAPHASQRGIHMERPEGSSMCIQGRKSYLMTNDTALVTCKSCLKLMDIEEQF